MKTGKIDKNIIIIIFGGLVLFLLTLLITPLADDWKYLSSPTVVTEYRLSHFRRLCDIVIGLFNQAHPQTFPWLNRILIVISHVICSLAMYMILTDTLKLRARLSLIFSLLFLIGGNTIATIINYDCFNQTGCMMFGALGIYLFNKANNHIKKFLVYISSYLLALCTKESGIVFFMIIPLFGFIKNLNEGVTDIKHEIKTLACFCIPGLVCAFIYYTSPIIQSEQLFVYGMGHVSAKQYLSGIARRLVFAYTQIDQLSVTAFAKSKVLTSEAIYTGISFVLSIPLLILSLLSFIHLANKKSRRAIVFLLLVFESIIVFTPTLMSSAAGSLWHQNCLVFFANIALCYVLNDEPKPALKLCIIAYIISSIIAGSRLLNQTIQTSKRQTRAIEMIQAEMNPNEKIQRYIVYNLNASKGIESTVYPFRLYSIQQLFDLGSDMVCIFGYDAKGTTVNLSNSQSDNLAYKGNRENMPEYFDMTDDELIRYAQQEAQTMISNEGYDLALVLLYTDEFYLYQPETTDSK